ncbi:tyrosine-protein phosphatase [Paraburkholderia sp. D15]|uniref:tyrosine-protein phosphatase n=1 Tax=Paraburkholderia sp. D15 TaxID=2880218 RepID=UPI002478A953|nr:tyrosine-protein phosphatase [Paraburkholderia sp. D15]WGS49588.1 tyrosine-protein phosphatase [Paraburkholderia sp. D15]
MPATAKNCSLSRRLASTKLPRAERVDAGLSLGGGAQVTISSDETSPSRRAFLRHSAGMLLMSGLGGSLLSACGGGNLSADQPPTPRVASVANFRDVAGAAAGYPTVDGKQMRRGAFYRANTLTLNAADAATLGKLAIATVYDLRTPGEMARTADVLPVGASLATYNVLGANDFVAPVFDTADAAAAFMEAQARAYVTGAAQRAGYGALLTHLAAGAGAQLFHSSAGKDRAGWVAALLLSIANVPLDVITQDYLLSNVYLAQSIETQIETLRAQDGDAVATVDTPLLNVQESYLQAGFEQVQASYGTMTAYLTQGLGLTQATIDLLRSRLVV